MSEKAYKRAIIYIYIYIYIYRVYTAKHDFYHKNVVNSVACVITHSC